MLNKKTVFVIVTVLAVGIVTSMDTVSADNFELKLTDAGNNDLSDPIFGGNVILYFDSYSDSHGVIYKMKAMQTLELVPSQLLIISEEGLFEVYVDIDGLTDYLASSGLRITLKSDDDTFHADLRSSNGFASAFKDSSGNVAIFNPNMGYMLGATTIDDVDTPIAPSSITNITITFRANVTSGYHQVVFISEITTNEREIVESYTVPDNYVINEVPIVTRSGYTFKGWYTIDNREVVPGFIVTSDDTDIFVYAEWEALPIDNQVDDSGFLWYIIVPIIGSMVAVIIGVAIYRKRNHS